MKCVLNLLFSYQNKERKNLIPNIYHSLLNGSLLVIDGYIQKLVDRNSEHLTFSVGWELETRLASGFWLGVFFMFAVKIRTGVDSHQIQFLARFASHFQMDASALSCVSLFPGPLRVMIHLTFSEQADQRTRQSHKPVMAFLQKSFIVTSSSLVIVINWCSATEF